MRCSSLPALAVFLVLFISAFAQDLPKQSGAEKSPAADALFLQDAFDLQPDITQQQLEADAPAVPVDVQRAQTRVQRLERKQQHWEKLGKAGVLSKVEVEKTILQTARARAEFQQLRVVQQKSELDALRRRAAAGEPDKEAIAAAEQSLQTAQTLEEEAATSLRRTQLLQAEVNVDRYRRLVAAGCGSKAQLKQAELALAGLKDPAPR